MLPKQHRLTKKAFSPSLFSGRRFVSGPVVLYIQTPTNAAHGPSRLAFVIGQKTAKKATARNLLRRRARAIVQARLSEVSGNRRAVFLFQQGSAELSLSELEESIDALLRRAGLLNKKPNETN